MTAGPDPQWLLALVVPGQVHIQRLSGLIYRKAKIEVC